MRISDWSSDVCSSDLTSGVVNVITAKPKLGAFEAAAEGEYGNYNSIKGKAMVNIPLGENAGIRVAGIYLNRDGYTKNLFLGKRFDDLDQIGRASCSERVCTYV